MESEKVTKAKAYDYWNSELLGQVGMEKGEDKRKPSAGKKGSMRESKDQEPA